MLFKNILAVFLSICISFMALAADKIPIHEVIRIKTSSSGLKPWNEFYDGYPFVIFNIAVHKVPFTFTKDMQIKPGYLKSFKWDYKRKKYILKIDRSLRYHNGQQISAYDFEFVLVKPLLTNLPGLLFPFANSIKGYDKIKRGDSFHTGILEGVKVVDNETLEVEPNGDRARFLYTLGADYPPLAPINSFKEDLYTFKDIPVGCGPYKVVWSDPKSSTVRLERVERVVGPRYVEFINDKRTAYEVDADIAIGSGLERMSGFVSEHPGIYSEIQLDNANSIERLDFNFTIDAVADINFRKAVAFAIDKTAPMAIYTDQGPAHQIIPKMAFGYQNKTSYYNLAKAKEYFAKLPAPFREKRYKLLGHGNAGQNPYPYYRNIRDSLEKIGMKIDLSMDPAVELDDSKKDIAMVIYGRTIDIDPLIVFSEYLPKPGRKNTPSSDTAFMDLFSKADSAESMSEKAKYIREMTDHIEENQIVLPLHETFSRGFITKKVKKIALTEITGYLDIPNTEINEQAFSK